ncbi:unnamed protein product, partial [Candidula unifasciata]
QKKLEEKKKKKVFPRDNKEWDKFDDAEIKAAVAEEKSMSRKTKVKGVSLDIDSTGMIKEEKNLKEKRNKAFKSQDFKEAVTYNTRSISFMATICDCNSLLNMVDNMKALIRCGTAYKRKHNFKKACKDLEKMLKLEPTNKKAEDLLKETKQISPKLRLMPPYLHLPNLKQPDADDECKSNYSSNEVSKQSPSSDLTESINIVSSFGTGQDNQVKLDQNYASSHQDNLVTLDSSSALPSAVPLSVKTSALFAETSDSSLLRSLPQEGTSSSSSKPEVSFSLNDSIAETTQAASQVTSDPTAPSRESHTPHLQFVQLPLPSAVSDLKEKGNLFRNSDQRVNLSVLLSNLVVCHLKTGNLSQTALSPFSWYHTEKKYAEAFVDYKHVIGLEASADQADQEKCGLVSWPEKIPPLVLVRDWEVPVFVDQAGLSRSMSSTVSLVDNDKHCQPDETPTTTIIYSSNAPKPETVVNQRSKEQEFDSLKARGNHSKKLSNVTVPASLCPDQVACFTNKSTMLPKALGLQSNNPRALYRRALARSQELLKLEPKNSAAQKEIDTVKLRLLKAEKESKVRKRLQQSASSKSKISISDKKHNNNVGKKQSQAQEAPTLGQPLAPPTAPRLMETTPYEFRQAWNSLKSCQVISNKLDGQMLQIIVRCVYERMVLKDLGQTVLGAQILDRLCLVPRSWTDCLVPRFSTVSMFMTNILSRTASSAWTAAAIVQLKKEYSVK